MRPKSVRNFNELNVVTDFCENNLAQVIANNDMQINQIKFLFYSIVRGLFFIHSRGIVHRNLRPNKVLINSQFDIKISDFGSASVVSDRPNPNADMERYLGYKFFWAPEVALGYQDGHD